MNAMTRPGAVPAAGQASLFDEGGSDAALPALGVPGSQTALGKAQKRFNQLIARIASQRDLLQQWRDFVLHYQQRHAARIEPLNQRLRTGRIAMAGLLDAAMLDRSLSKLQRAKVQDLLLGLLSGLLAEAPDDELVRLYDRHSDLSHEEAQQEEMAFTRAMAREVFGVELGDAQEAQSPQDLARRIAEEMQAAQARRSAARKGRKKSAKAIAAEAVREQAAQGASRALREVFRRLASELHPDREPDVSERARKTALMQQANAAYAAGDLLTLLELQLRLEQIDARALAGMAQDRLAHYNHVLEEQLQRLQEELSDLTMPFAMLPGARAGSQFTPDSVLRALNDEARELGQTVESLERDLLALCDIRVLKQMLRDYRIGQGDLDDVDGFADMQRAKRRAARPAKGRR